MSLLDTGRLPAIDRYLGLASAVALFLGVIALSGALLALAG